MKREEILLGTVKSNPTVMQLTKLNSHQPVSSPCEQPPKISRSPHMDRLRQDFLYENPGAGLEFPWFAFSVSFLQIVPPTKTPLISTNGHWLPNLYIQLWALHWAAILPDYTTQRLTSTTSCSNPHVQSYSLFPTCFPPAHPSSLHLGGVPHSPWLIGSLPTLCLSQKSGSTPPPLSSPSLIFHIF